MDAKQSATAGKYPRAGMSRLWFARPRYKSLVAQGCQAGDSAGAQTMSLRASTREERIHTIMAAWQADVLMPAIDINLLRTIVVLVMDAADATRDPCPCRQCHLDRLAKGGGLDG